jgi:hypothetical protein
LKYSAIDIGNKKENFLEAGLRFMRGKGVLRGEATALNSFLKIELQNLSDSPIALKTTFQT